jgi:hypothetical protein
MCPATPALSDAFSSDDPSDNQYHGGDEGQQDEHDPQMLHNPAGNVHGVR